jgi:D-3-phosphoglycerate dehydrogenase
MTAEALSGGRPKVLVPEKVSPDGLALLRKTLDVHEKKGLTPDQLLEIIGKYVII